MTPIHDEFDCPSFEGVLENEQTTHRCCLRPPSCQLNAYCQKIENNMFNNKAQCNLWLFLVGQAIVLVELELTR